MKRVNKHTVYTLTFIVLLAAIITVTAQTAIPAPNPGHTGDQIVSDRGLGDELLNTILTNLEIRLGNLEAAANNQPSNLKTLPGKIEIVGVDESGNNEFCWFKIKIEGNQVYPKTTPECTGNDCIQTADLDEITQNKCHNYALYYLRNSLTMDDASIIAGERVRYYNYEVTDLNIPGATQYTDIEFEFEYATNPQQIGQPVQLQCPSSCQTHQEDGGGGTCTPTQTTLNANLYEQPHCCTTQTPGPIVVGTITSINGLGCWPTYL